MRTIERLPHAVGGLHVRGLRNAGLGPALLLVLAIPLAACGSGSSSPSPTATSPPATQTTATASGSTAKSVSLTLKDMPAGYTQTQAQSTSLPQQGYTAYYVSFNNSANSPTIVVQSKVEKFVNDKGATTAYPQFVGNAHQSGGFSDTGPVSGLGSQSTTGSKTTAHSNGTEIVQHGVVFQQGVFLASVSSTGPKAQVSQQQVNNLAVTIDHNIKSGK
jgi:hypothetical protein